VVVSFTEPAGIAHFCRVRCGEAMTINGEPLSCGLHSP
jgi:hypothetical protein